jgi:hypothetical protein
LKLVFETDDSDDDDISVCQQQRTYDKQALIEVYNMNKNILKSNKLKQN